MTVFIAIGSNPYENTDVVGVCLTRAEAQAVIDRNKNDLDALFYENYHIEEWSVSGGRLSIEGGL